MWNSSWNSLRKHRKVDLSSAESHYISYAHFICLIIMPLSYLISICAMMNLLFEKFYRFLSYLLLIWAVCTYPSSLNSFPQPLLFVKNGPGIWNVLSQLLVIFTRRSLRQLDSLPNFDVET